MGEKLKSKSYILRKLAAAVLALAMIFGNPISAAGEGNASGGEKRAFLAASVGGSGLGGIPEGDAISMQSMLMKAKGWTGGQIEIYRADFDSETVKAGFLNELERFFEGSREGDTNIIYYSGQGVLGGDGLDSAFGLGIGEENLLWGRELRARLDGISGTFVLIIDACYSGALISKGKRTADSEARPADSEGESLAEGFISAFSQEGVSRAAFGGNKYKIIAAAGAQEQSWQSEYGGFFSNSLLTGLGFSAYDSAYNAYPADSNCDGSITMAELAQWCERENWMSNSRAYPERDGFVILNYDNNNFLGNIVSARITTPLISNEEGQMIGVEYSTLYEVSVGCLFSLNAENREIMMRRPQETVLAEDIGGIFGDSYLETVGAATFPAAAEGARTEYIDVSAEKLIPGKVYYLRLLPNFPGLSSGALNLPFQVEGREGGRLSSADDFALLSPAKEGETVFRPTRVGTEELEIAIRFSKDPLPDDLPEPGRLPATGCVLDCVITDMEGTVMRTLAASENAEYFLRGSPEDRALGGTKSFFWDGRGDDGGMLPAGKYLVKTGAAYSDGRRGDAAAIVKLDLADYDRENGDIDGDGKIDAYDAFLLYEHVRAAAPLDESGLKWADVNLDGKTDILDADRLRRFADGGLQALRGETTFAESGLSITVEASAAAAKKGESLTYEIYLDGTAGTKLCALAFKMDLPKQLEVISGTLQENLEGLCGFAGADFDSKTLLFTAYGGSGFEGERLRLLTLECKVGENAQGSGTLVLLKEGLAALGAENKYYSPCLYGADIVVEGETPPEDKIAVEIGGAAEQSEVYSGMPLPMPAEGITADTPDGGFATTELEYWYSGGAQTPSKVPPIDAGIYTVTVKVADSNPFYTGSARVIYRIAPKRVAPTAGYVKREYSGGNEAEVKFSFAPGELAARDSVGVTARGCRFAQKDVGKDIEITLGDISVDGGGRENYEIVAPAPPKGEILPKKVDIKVEGQTPQVYTGQPKKLTATYPTLGGESQNMTLLYDGSENAPSLAGKYSVSARINDKNYTPGELIGPAALEITRGELSAVMANEIIMGGDTRPKAVKVERFALAAPAGSAAPVGRYELESISDPDGIIDGEPSVSDVKISYRLKSSAAEGERAEINLRFEARDGTYAPKLLKINIAVGGEGYDNTLIGMPYSVTLGEELDLSRARIRTVYSSGREATEFPVTPEMVEGYDRGARGEGSVGTLVLRVTYPQESNITATASVVVLDFMEDFLVVAPDKLEYAWNREELDTSGASVQPLMRSGTRKNPTPLLLGMTSGFKRDLLGEQRLTVTYNGLEKTGAFGVEVTCLLTPEAGGVPGISAGEGTIFISEDGRTVEAGDVRLKILPISGERARELERLMTEKAGQGELEGTSCYDLTLYEGVRGEAARGRSNLSTQLHQEGALSITLPATEKFEQGNDIILMLKRKNGSLELLDSTQNKNGITFVLEDMGELALGFGHRSGHSEYRQDLNTTKTLRRTAGRPAIAVDREGISFWKGIENTVMALPKGSIIKVDAKGFDRLPVTLLKTLEGRGLSLIISWLGGEDIILSGNFPLEYEKGRVYYPLLLLEQLLSGEANPQTGGAGPIEIEVEAPPRSVEGFLPTPEWMGIEERDEGEKNFPALYMLLGGGIAAAFILFFGTPTGKPARKIKIHFNRRRKLV